MPTETSYELIDLGGGARLERFADRVVDRPAPGALSDRHDVAAWREPDLRFDRERGWSGPASDAGPWSVTFADLILELRPTAGGQVGLFPEHAAMLSWLERHATGTVLNLFAYTGLATLALARVGASVTHVDAAKTTVSWAHRNADLSGLADRPTRWIVDDAAAFVDREVRRGRRYDGIVLDPPSYGHGPDGRPWRLGEDLSTLLIACRGLLTDGGSVLLTAHSVGFDGDRLATELGAAFRRRPGDIEAGDLGLATRTGHRLELGAFARIAGGAS